MVKGKNQDLLGSNIPKMGDAAIQLGEKEYPKK